MNNDAIKGMFLGLVIGDCLGMPHEFSRKKDQLYSDVIITTSYTNQWQGKRTTALGQGSDDSEMSFALYNCIKENGFKYNKDKVALRYMEFAANSSFLGKNTVALFKGVKTLKGYQNRCEKVFAETVSQSNGSLMRISPLVFVTDLNPDNIRKIVELDTGLSNPCNVNYAFGFIYLCILKHLVEKVPFDIDKIINIAIDFYPDVAELILTLNNPVPEINGKDKGWVRHAAHVAIDALKRANKSDFKTLIGEVVKRGGDTDTTAAITGALLGAYYGKETMLKDEVTAKNISIVENCDTNTGSYPKPTFMTLQSTF